MIREYFALRRFIREPWAFLRTRRRPMAGPHEDVEFRDGFRVRLRAVPMDRHIFHRIFARDEYRLDGVAPGSWDTVVDVGAHIGLFAVRAAPLARRLLSFEPERGNFEALRHNLSVPRFSHVVAERKAVAGRRGRVSFYPSANPSAHSMIPAAGAEAVEVDAVTLADVFAEHGVERCDLLKLDCEGAEYEILRSVPDALWPRIRRIGMEYHPVADGGWSGAALEAFLTDRGYDCGLFPSRKKPEKGLLFAERGRRP